MRAKRPGRDRPELRYPDGYEVPAVRIQWKDKR